MISGVIELKESTFDIILMSWLKSNPVSRFKMAAATILNILVVTNWLTELLKYSFGGFECREFIIDVILMI